MTSPPGSLAGILRPAVQIAYFVSDIRSAAERMHRSFGAGPFYVIENIRLARAEHWGESCLFVHSSAYGQWGSVMLELVQQDVEGPSPFRDLFPPGAEGLHHWRRLSTMSKPPSTPMPGAAYPSPRAPGPRRVPNSRSSTHVRRLDT